METLKEELERRRKEIITAPGFTFAGICKTDQESFNRRMAGELNAAINGIRKWEIESHLESVDYEK